MFYVIRTLTTSGTRILCKRIDVQIDGECTAPVEYGYPSRADAKARADTIPGSTAVHEFHNDAAARMYLDPACVGFRTKHDSRAEA